ncbi:MAG: hypothetical protein ACYDHW_01170 [Syntrophorhabdaceae bacterium]
MNELTTKPNKIIVRVGSNGCTGKGSFRVDVKKEEGLSKKSPHYVLTIVRTGIDECKALTRGGSLITFNMAKDLGLKGYYTYSVTNRIFQNERLVIDESKIRNYRYFLTLPKEHVQLKNGKFEKGNKPDTHLNVKLMDHAIEDLDGNGTDDAIVILSSTGMGSGSFFEITALIADSEEDFVHQTNSIVLGDRVEMNGLSVTPEKIELKLTVPGPDDPSCCPTKKVTRQFKIMGGRLVELQYGPEIRRAL